MRQDMDFETLARSRLDKIKLITSDSLSVEPMSEQLRRILEDGTSRNIRDGVILNERVGVCRNNWGHKYGQTSFIVFERVGTRWSTEHLGNFEVEWRGPKREELPEAQIDTSLLSALDRALKAAIKELL